jgi:hypothetical protein
LRFLAFKPRFERMHNYCRQIETRLFTYFEGKC